VKLFADFMNSLFDLLCAPFGSSAAWAMLAISLLSGVVMLLLFKVSTNQQRLDAAKRKIMGHLYEMGLYQDHLGILMRIQGNFALANLRYLGVTLPALVFLLPVIVLILAQLDSRFAHRPFLPGEATLLTATLDHEQEGLLEQLDLAAPAGVTVESLPVRDHRARTATWRLRVQAVGHFELILSLPDGRQWTKKLVADGDGLPRLAETREKPGWHHALLNPAEVPLPPAAPLESVNLKLPGRQTRYAGLSLHWLLAFCLFSLLFGISLKDVFRVKI
jgi:hypothetical protein